MNSPPPDVPPAPQTASPQPEGSPTLQTASSQPEVPPAPPTASPQLEAPPTSQTTLPQPEVPPAKIPKVSLIVRERPAQGEKEPDKGVPMDVDEAPQVRFHACFISGRFLTLERSLSAVGGQKVLRMLPLKESGTTCLRQ
jgi:hypothetical protein